MGRDGVHYDITQHPELVDDLGVVHPRIHTDLKDNIQHEPSMMGATRLETSNHLGMFTTALDELFADLHWGEPKRGELGKGKDIERIKDHREWLKEIKIIKVFQDDPIKQVYQNAMETFYATTRQPCLELPILHVVVVERLEGFPNCIRD